MTGLAETVSELADLWPALAAALARDTGGEGGAAGHAWMSALVVNADVLAAMITLDREIPAIIRYACEAIGEPWQHRDIAGCLLQVPRLAGRMHDLGQAGNEKMLACQADGWLRMVKRALGLRRPDIGIGYDCPYAGSVPEQHTGDCALLAAGDEGFLRPGTDGLRVEWAHTPVIYCASPDCDASWGLAQWSYLGRLLESATMAVTRGLSCTIGSHGAMAGRHPGHRPARRPQAIHDPQLGVPLPGTPAPPRHWQAQAGTV